MGDNFHICGANDADIQEFGRQEAQLLIAMLRAHLQYRIKTSYVSNLQVLYRNVPSLKQYELRPYYKGLSLRHLLRN